MTLDLSFKELVDGRCKPYRSNRAAAPGRDRLH
ncbi:hypothetical protein ACVIHB_009976 [Bradyrhizobium liaoningense]